MTDPRQPNRADLAKVFKDQRTLRAFERVFDVIPGDIDSLSVAISRIAALANAAESGTKALDYIDFLPSPHSSEPGRVAWNSDSDTLDVHHTGGVTQQVGLESYIRAKNSTVSTIPNGSVVGISGSVDGVVSASPYIADGSSPAEYVLGLATQDIEPGEIGRITVFGIVHEIDTSALTVGQIVYASPSVAGGYTTTRPTSPNMTVMLGVVTKVDATDGEILVRPVIEQSKRFAFAKSINDQTLAAFSTAYALTLDSIDGCGFSLGTPSSRIVASAPGVYDVHASIQLVSSSASAKQVLFWFRKNGADIATSSVKGSIDGSSMVLTISNSLNVSLTTGDYLEVCWGCNNVNVTATAFGPASYGPGSASVTVKIIQVQ